MTALAGLGVDRRTSASVGSTAAAIGTPTKAEQSKKTKCEKRFMTVLESQNRSEERRVILLHHLVERNPVNNLRALKIKYLSSFHQERLE
jgi:hypothetical protein